MCGKFVIYLAHSLEIVGESFLVSLVDVSREQSLEGSASVL
jgi:hypothetical protein